MNRQKTGKAQMMEVNGNKLNGYWCYDLSLLSLRREGSTDRTGSHRDKDWYGEVNTVRSQVRRLKPRCRGWRSRKVTHGKCNPLALLTLPPGVSSRESDAISSVTRPSWPDSRYYPPISRYPCPVSHLHLTSYGRNEWWDRWYEETGHVTRVVNLVRGSWIQRIRGRLRHFP